MLVLILSHVFKIGEWLLYSVVFVSAVQLCESARSTHMSPPSCASLPLPIPSHCSRSSQSMELSSLCCTTASHYLSVLHVVVYIWEGPLEKGMATYSSILAWRIPLNRGAWQATVHGVAESRMWLSDFHLMNVRQRYPLNSSHPFLPPLGPQVHSLHLRLYSCPADRFVSTIFLDSLYMCCWLLLSHVQLFTTPWTAAHQAFSSFTIFQSLLKLTSVESTPSNHLSSFAFLFLTDFTLYGRL